MFQNNDNNHSNNTHEESGKTNWVPWTLVVVMGALLALQYFGNSGAAGSTVPLSSGFNWFSLLAGLICPLMMLFMMSGHSHGHNHSNGNDQENNPGGSGRGGCCGGHQANK